MDKLNETLSAIADYTMVCKSMYQTTNNPLTKKMWVDGLRNAIFYNCSSEIFWTGLQTESCSGKPKTKLSKEHQYGLKKLAEEILNSNWTRDEIIEYIKKNAKWNYTTKEENQLLKHNNQDYELLGLKLIKRRKGAKKDNKKIF
jgi:hydroxylamine reductase (hybrid-cluster protein)